MVPALRRRRARVRLHRPEDARAHDRGAAHAPAEGHRPRVAPLVHGPGARGGLPGGIAVGRRPQPVADDVPARRLPQGRGPR